MPTKPPIRHGSVTWNQTCLGRIQYRLAYLMAPASHWIGQILIRVTQCGKMTRYATLRAQIVHVIESFSAKNGMRKFRESAKKQAIASGKSCLSSRYEIRRRTGLDRLRRHWAPPRNHRWKTENWHIREKKRCRDDCDDALEDVTITSRNQRQYTRKA